LKANNDDTDQYDNAYDVVIKWRKM
jgi:hypothetical protein